nr:uncharacterized protein LOC113812374 [Penaeus vannamei]
MNSRVFVALLLCGLWASSESLILLGTTAAAGTIAATTVTASAAAALGVGALAVLKGVLIGKHLKRRYRRDVDSMEIDDEVEVAVAKELDSAGCIAKLLCEIEATPPTASPHPCPPSRRPSRIPTTSSPPASSTTRPSPSPRTTPRRAASDSTTRLSNTLRIQLPYSVTSIYHHQTGTVQHTAHAFADSKQAFSIRSVTRLPPSTRYKYRALPGTNITLVLSLLQNTSSGTIAATTVTASAAAALGVGALAVLKGVLIGKHLKRRYRRDVDSMEEDVATEIAVAQKMDSAGCVAKLLCEIEAMSADQLTPAMSTFKTAFDNNSNLKGSRGVYDLAITFGSKFAKKDAKACSALFDKCVLSRDDLSFMLDSTFSC